MYYVADAGKPVAVSNPILRLNPQSPYLRFDEHQVNEEHNKVMLDILVAKVAAIATHRESNIMAACLIAGAGVLRP